MPYINYYNPSFSFLITGASFPLISETVQGLFSLTFSSAVTVNISFGDGTSQDYVSMGSSNAVSLAYNVLGQPANTYAPYEYPDALNIDRRISVNIDDEDRDKLTGIIFSNLQVPLQFLTLSFNTYPNLTTLTMSLLRGHILGFDQSFVTLNNFTSYNINNDVLNPSSPFYGIVPSILLNKSGLTSLSIGDPGFSTKSFADSNLDKIATSFPLLQSLTLAQMGTLDDHMGDGALPANLTTLTTLNSVLFHSTLWTTMPAILNSIPHYTVLNVQYSNTITNWGDLSPIASRLTAFSVAACNNLPDTLPAYFSLMTSLRKFSWNTVGYNGTANINNLISNWYILITTNAAITGSSSLPFRGLTFIINGDPAPSHAIIPSGTYQQPVGYSQGVTNGTPASSLERLWVLANQYGHINTYRAI